MTADTSASTSSVYGLGSPHSHHPRAARREHRITVGLRADPTTRGALYYGPHIPSPGPAGSLVIQLWQSLFAPSRADVTFLCKDGMRVKGNRTVLSASSRFFDCLLDGKWVEGGQTEIRLPTVDARLLESYIFAHFRTGGVPAAATEDDLATVLDAYELARQYCLPTLETHLLAVLVKKLDLCSANWLLRRALDGGSEDLMLCCLERLASAWSRAETGGAVEGLTEAATTRYLQLHAPAGENVAAEHCLTAAIEWGREQLGLSEDIWRGGSTPEERADLVSLIQPLLDNVRLEEVPWMTLEEEIEPLEIFSRDRLLQAYKAQLKAAAPVRIRVDRRSFWDEGSLPSSVIPLDPRTVQFRGLQGHVGVRSKLGLTCGKWTWKLRFRDIGRKYAWAGLVDDSADLNAFPGSQVGGYLYGSSGLVRTKSAAAAHLGSETRAGPNWHSDGATVTVRLDMDAREAAFDVGEVSVGVLFRDLPSRVYPAASLSGGGTVEFLEMTTDDSSCSV